MKFIWPDNILILFPIFLLLVGLFGIIGKKNLIKQLIGLNILQAAVILFFILFGYKSGASVPIVDARLGSAPDAYINPLPHGLMLTAIVVSVATTGLALMLLRLIHQRWGSLEEKDLLP